MEGVCVSAPLAHSSWPCLPFSLRAVQASELSINQSRSGPAPSQTAGPAPFQPPGPGPFFQVHGPEPRPSAKTIQTTPYYAPHGYPAPRTKTSIHQIDRSSHAAGGCFSFFLPLTLGYSRKVYRPFVSPTLKHIIFSQPFSSPPRGGQPCPRCPLVIKACKNLTSEYLVGQ